MDVEGNRSAGSTSEPTLVMEDVSFSYANGREGAGVRRVDLQAASGEVVLLCGPSGCGKTTLMRMVNAMVTPTSGTVFVRGHDVAGEDPVRLRRSIGYVLQEGGLFPHRSIADNIATVPRLEGATKQASRERALELLTLVGLDREMADRYPAQLSGGQRQRVGVARALANRADILLMDEPTSALDPISTSKIEDLIHELKKEYTIVIVTHNMQQAARVSDKTGYFYLGELVEYGETRKIFTNPEKESTQNYITGRFG